MHTLHKPNSQIPEVVRALARHPKVTSMELAQLVQMDRHLIARRLPEAEKEGLVKRGKQRKCAISQRNAITWQTTTSA